MAGGDLEADLEFPLGERSASLPADLARADLLGVDLLFTDDLQVGASGDYLEVSGLENVRRAILRRMLVRPGEYKLRPEYGVGIMTFVKRASSQAMLDELRARAEQNLARDKRIQRASVNVERTSFGGRAALRVTVVARVLGRNVRFSPFTFAEPVRPLVVS